MKIKEIFKLDKSSLIWHVEQTTITVRSRIREQYAKKNKPVPNNFEGECNRACLMFYIYFCNHMRWALKSILVESLFDDDEHVKYDTVNMPNIDYLSTSNILEELGITIDIIHGEQRHTKKIPEEYWRIEHTWLAIKWRKTTIYCDPTSGQFKDLYPDIPNYYISTRKPKWFFPDIENPEWNNREYISETNSRYF